MNQYRDNRRNSQQELSQEEHILIQKCVNDFPVEAAAEEFANRLVQKMSQQKMTIAQLRKFYNEFKSLERKYITTTQNDKADAFENIFLQVKITKAKASYAKGRKIIPLLFEEWLKKSVDAINDYKSFEKFLLHFESIVGYTYGYACDLGLKD